MRSRGFEVVKKYEMVEDFNTPIRSTAKSAGYDFIAFEDVTIEPMIFNMLKEMLQKCQQWFHIIARGEITDKDVTGCKPRVVWTGVKAYMGDDEVLYLYNRSSNPKKMGLVLANGVGVVDSDYYGNVDNDGEIGFAFYNILPWKVTFHEGDRIGQAVFSTFLKADEDTASGERKGGYGSTDKA